MMPHVESEPSGFQAAGAKAWTGFLLSGPQPTCSAYCNALASVGHYFNSVLSVTARGFSGIIYLNF